MKFSKSVFAISMLLGVLVTQINSILPVNAQAGQVTLNPIDDAYTALDEPDTPHNFGLNVMNTHVDLGAGEYADYVRWAWLKFDLFNVPDGAIIETATLKLRTLTVGISGTQKVSVHCCQNNSWSEFTITYSNQPEYSHVSMDSIIVEEPFLFYAWNVIDAIKSAVDGIYNKSDVVTLVLQEDKVHDNDFTGVNFYHKEGIEVFMPKLTIEWSGVIPEFPTWASMLLVLIVLTVVIVTYKRRLLKTPIQ